MRKSLLFFLLFINVCGVWAQTPPKPPTPSTPLVSIDVAPVTVEGRRLFDIGSSASASAGVRAARVNRRIQNLIEREVDLPPFTRDNVEERGGEQVIVLGNVEVLTVTQGDAIDAGQSARDLALQQGEAIAGAIRQARTARANVFSGATILIANSLQGLVNSFLMWLPRVFAALLLTGVFSLLAKGSRGIATASTRRFGLDPNLRALVRALSFYSVWFIGILAILSALGFDSSSLVAAVGVSGFVLGFAFKDILSHFLAGILLLVSGRFRIGDQIVVKEFEGTVERIELRALELRTYDNRLVIIPNGDVFSAPITSNTASAHRRRTFTVPVPHEYDIVKATDIMAEAIRKTPGVLTEPEVDVVVDEITKEAVILRARFSTHSSRTDFVHVGSECMKNVKIAFAHALKELNEQKTEETPPEDIEVKEQAAAD